MISGDRLIDGKQIGIEFQRGCGYAEQQDIHEGTATVREALRFSAYLRQPASVPKEDKDAYVEDIIELLEMQDIADAMIGIPEFGLGIGDRKRVTIGVELAAVPTFCSSWTSPPRASTVRQPSTSFDSSRSSPLRVKPSSAPSTSQCASL